MEADSMHNSSVDGIDMKSDDLITRLEEAGRVGSLCWEAAAEIERLRASVNELVLWAEIGAQAIQDWDGYEKDISGDGIDRNAGLRLLDRIDAGEFGKVRRD